MSKKNQALFESLYTQYHAMVLHLCVGFMQGDRALAHDLSQEVFINVWNALDKFKGDASYKTWIYRITVNTSLQYIRKEKSRQRQTLHALDQLASEAESLAESEHQRLYHAIGELKEVDRLIIMLVLEELDNEEIAKVVGITAFNLRVRIHRIKKRLKKIMAHEQQPE